MRRVEKRTAGSKRARPRAAAGNRKVPASGRRARAPVDPGERKTRNRTILALGLLALVNLYVFGLRDGGGLGDLGQLGSASISGTQGPLPPLASAPEQACGGDPVRIFEGLGDLISLQTQLGAGYTLRLSLLQLGIASDEIDRVEADVRTHVDLSLLGGSGAPLRLAMDRFGTIHALEIELAEGHILQACRNAGDGRTFEVRNIQHPLRTDVEVVALELGADADLARAVLEAGEKPELADQIARTLASDVDFLTETRPGDKLAVMVEKRWLGRRFHRYGQIMAARFQGAAARVAYYRYKPEGGSIGYYDGDGQPVRRALLRSPVAFFAVDVEARGLLPPSIEMVQGRLGAVYRLPEGAPVVALGDGVVEAVDRSASEGHVLELRFDDGTLARYAHVLRVVGELTPGTRVQQGQIVALAGHSGRTPNDRLRLELVRELGDEPPAAVDPLLLLGRDSERPPVVGAAIEGDAKQRFTDDIASWTRALKLAR